ncbi:MAG: hypothetical protein AAFO01_11715 [Pseudomonadota bacterium]
METRVREADGDVQRQIAKITTEAAARAAILPYSVNQFDIFPSTKPDHFIFVFGSALAMTIQSTENGDDDASELIVEAKMLPSMMVSRDLAKALLRRLEVFLDGTSDEEVLGADSD